ncbi:Hypothetical protein NGAL_HAMBI2566_43810 [Neorhizobium galegae bv. orientalis]|nr:Hypothetical protein NGAL_HAMBI2566_43810 [Neorhizobium galegae bv. orientalis]
MEKGPESPFFVAKSTIGKSTIRRAAASNRAG